MTEDSPRYFLKSLAKGIRVIQALADTSEPLSLTELSRASDTNSATATRICHTLAKLGLVRRDRQLRFHLTPKILSLGYSALGNLGWRQVAQHYLELLAEDSGETVNLSILQGRELMYLVRIRNTGRILPYELQLGSRLPLHCTSMGKSLLAFAPAEQVEHVLADYEFVALTHRTITSLARFRAELEEVRRQGYSVNDEELSVGLRSVAAPIRGLEGESVAALNIAVPTARVSLEDLKARLAPQAMDTARRIERALGSTEEF